MFKALFIVLCAMFAFNFSAVACPGVKDCPLHKSGDKAHDCKKEGCKKGECPLHKKGDKKAYHNCKKKDCKKGECKLHKNGDKMAHHNCQKEGCKKGECKLHKKGGDYHKKHGKKDDKKG